MSEGAFFQDLAMLTAIAGIVAAVFSRFGWPKVLGYILAGIFLNEHTWGGCFLANAASTQTVGQMGVVFLMFGMGISFSPRAMSKIRSVVIPAAVLDTIVMIWIGYTLGTRLFGWSTVQSFFLGVAICDSATTLLAKVIGELGWEKRTFTKYVLGTSICEDIVCVGAIAVASGFATGGTMSMQALLTSLGGLGIFFLSTLVFGFILVPRLLVSVSKRKDDESLLLALLGCCFLITYLAWKMNCSLALGAFLVGIIGGSSDVRDRLERLVEPLKALYSAIFFISIGLLVDPAALLDCLPQILLVSGVVIVGKFLNITIASVATGLPVKTAVQTGLCLAQIGEFAFMVAILYAGLSPHADGRFFTIAVGVSLLTTLLNPLFIRLSERAGDFAERMLPARLHELLESYQGWVAKVRESNDSPGLTRIRGEAIRLGVYAVLMMAVSISFSQLHRFDFSRFSSIFEHYDRLIFFLAANVFALSLVPLVIASARQLGLGVARVLIGKATARWVRPVYQIIRVVTLAGVLLLFFLIWSMLDLANAPEGVTLWVLVVIFALIALFGWRFFSKTGHRATARFQEALTAEERREGLVKTMTISIPEGTVQRFTLDAQSPAIGETVVTLNVRAKTGASIVSVIRDGHVTRNIGPEWEFRVGDTVIALGEGGQIAALKDLLGVTS